jgi:hypothetical protein
LTELVYVLRSGLEADAHGLPGLGLITGGVRVGGGMHGGLNRHELNTVFILGKAGQPRGGEVSSATVGIIDIGPTILQLLGLAPAASMRGISLTSTANRAARTETHETGVGAFRQRFTVVRDAERLLPVHGQRVA